MSPSGVFKSESGSNQFLSPEQMFYGKEELLGRTELESSKKTNVQSIND